MSTDIPADAIGEIMQDYNFSIVDLVADPDTTDTAFIIVHDLHPEDEIKITLVSNEVDGEDSMELKFEGPDEWTEDEAKIVLHEVMAMVTAVIEEAVEGEDTTPIPEPEPTIPEEED